MITVKDEYDYFVQGFPAGISWVSKNSSVHFRSIEILTEIIMVLLKLIFQCFIYKLINYTFSFNFIICSLTYYYQFSFIFTGRKRRGLAFCIALQYITVFFGQKKFEIHWNENNQRMFIISCSFDYLKILNCQFTTSWVYCFRAYNVEKN